jgi:hypothetical protein
VSAVTGHFTYSVTDKRTDAVTDSEQASRTSHGVRIGCLLGSYQGTRTGTYLGREPAMAVDPTDPETFEDENAAAELDVEAPEDDAAEQLADVTQGRDDPPARVDPDSANEADVIEQARVVSIDEDDYR